LYADNGIAGSLFPAEAKSPSIDIHILGIGCHSVSYHRPIFGNLDPTGQRAQFRLTIP
jgi:hypothetical protein